MLATSSGPAAGAAVLRCWSLLMPGEDEKKNDQKTKLVGRPWRSAQSPHHKRMSGGQGVGEETYCARFKRSFTRTLD